MNVIVLNDFRVVPTLTCIRLKKSVPNTRILLSRLSITNIEYANYQPKWYKLIVASTLRLFYDAIIISDKEEDRIITKTDTIGLQSSLITITEQSSANQKSYPEIYNNLFNQVVGSKSIVRYINKTTPNNVFLFNGRTASSFSISKNCFEKKIKCAYYEYAGHANGFRLYPGIPPHSVSKVGEYLLSYYRNSLLSLNEEMFMTNFFISEKMNSVFSKKNFLVDNKLHDIVVFFGSDFEYQCIDYELTGVDYKGIIDFSKKVIKKYGENRTYTFRFHPNSKSDKEVSNVIKDLKNLCNRHCIKYTIYGPENEINSHKLIECSRLVVTDLSTICLDSMILGKEVDIFGNTDIKTVYSSDWFEQFKNDKKYMLAAPYSLRHNFMVFRFNIFESIIAKVFYYIDEVSRRIFIRRNISFFKKI